MENYMNCKKLTLPVIAILYIFCGNEGPSGPTVEDCHIEPHWGLWVPVQDQYDSATIAHFLPWLPEGAPLPGITDTSTIDSTRARFGSASRSYTVINDTMYLDIGINHITGSVIRMPLQFSLINDTLFFFDTTFANPATMIFNKYYKANHKVIEKEQGKSALWGWQADCKDVPECFWEE